MSVTLGSVAVSFMPLLESKKALINAYRSQLTLITYILDRQGARRAV